MRNLPKLKELKVCCIYAPDLFQQNPTLLVEMKTFLKNGGKLTWFDYWNITDHLTYEASLIEDSYWQITPNFIFLDATNSMKDFCEDSCLAEFLSFLLTLFDYPIHTNLKKACAKLKNIFEELIDAGRELFQHDKINFIS